MESLRKIFDALLAAIFPVKRKRRLKDVSSEDLRRERIKLEQSESRITGDIIQDGSIQVKLSLQHLIPP